MKEKIKYLLTVLLLAFACFTLAFQVAKEFRSINPMKLSDGLNVICTHATSRCVTCTTIERLAKETLDENFSEMVKAGRIIFREVNYEHSEANDFSNEYKVATASVVLVNIWAGKTVGGVSLANESWRLHTDEPAFKAMLKEQIEAMLRGKTLEIDDSPQEIIFGDDEEISLPL